MNGAPTATIGKRLPCGHEFEKICITEWLQISSGCPLCRHDITQPAPATPTVFRPSGPAQGGDRLGGLLQTQVAPSQAVPTVSHLSGPAQGGDRPGGLQPRVRTLFVSAIYQILTVLLEFLVTRCASSSAVGDV